MKKVTNLLIAVFILVACQGTKQLSNRSYQKQLRRVTPTDIQINTQKIIIDKYQFVAKESYNRSTATYLETAWKQVPVTNDEKVLNFDNTRIRIKIRSRETRGGPTGKYDVHSLLFTAETQGYKSLKGSGKWMLVSITPQRQEYLDKIFRAYKLEFNDGVKNFN